MEIHGNATTFNLENVLRQNIVGSDYYRQTCTTLTNWSDIVDEIFESVDNVEPWLSGNARGASTAFCLLHRLCALKLTVKQVKDMLEHKDSPYIRAVGFLYLRYVGDPKTLWQWCGPYIKDSEMFAPSGPGQKSVTMGEYVRDLLLSQYYFETIFPRIPKPVQDNINEELKSRGLPTTAKGNGGAGGADRRGMDDSSTRRPASVKASLSVAFGQRAPNRSGTREEGRGRDPSLHERDAGRGRGSASPEPPRDRGDRDRGYDRDGGRREASGRDFDRDRRGGRDYDRSRGGRDHDRGGRDFDRDRDRGRGYDDRDKDRGRDSRRSRSRSRSRGRDTRDVFKEAAPRDGRREDEVRDRYGNGSSRR